MRKVFLDELPHFQSKIDWNNSMGYKINFIYDNMYGTFKIICYDKNTRKIKFSYKNETYEKHTSDIIKCNINNIVYINKNNKLYITNPNVAKLLANPEDGIKYSKGSSVKVDWVCPDCGNIIKNTRIKQVVTQGLFCNKCSKGISYPEKFMINLLDQINIEYKTQLSKSTFKWCNKYKYDFYIPQYNCIIETHGSQHYEKGFFAKNGLKQSLENVKKNDLQKQILAISNGIENYIIVDCRKSTSNWIKNSIIKSDLNKILKLNNYNINWDQCHDYSCTNTMKKAINLWNSGINDYNLIKNILHINKCTCYDYIEQAIKLGLCKKRIKKEKIKKQYRQIICINTKVIYKSIVEAEQIENIKHIRDCLSGKYKSAGKLPDGTPLHWMYLDEYEKLYSKIEENIAS